MGLSSNILWHQTQKDALKKILKQKSFRYSYSLEHLEAKNDTLECAFPMLSLCDIPFTDIGEYLTKYGGNSIGLSRDWGKKCGITPVVYCEPTSNLLNNIINTFKSESANISPLTLNLLSHIKNHEGELPKYSYRKYRFYDEHEVRIIPNLNELNRIEQKPILSKNDYNNYKDNNKNSSMLPDSLHVSFEYEDLRYFILKDEESIKEIKKILSKEIDLNESKISFFTIQQVKEDFIGEEHNEVIDDININNYRNNFVPINDKINIDNKDMFSQIMHHS